MGPLCNFSHALPVCYNISLHGLVGLSRIVLVYFISLACKEAWLSSKRHAHWSLCLVFSCL